MSRRERSRNQPRELLNPNTTIEGLDNLVKGAGRAGAKVAIAEPQNPTEFACQSYLQSLKSHEVNMGVPSCNRPAYYHGSWGKGARR